MTSRVDMPPLLLLLLLLLTTTMLLSASPMRIRSILARGRPSPFARSTSRTRCFATGNKFVSIPASDVAAVCGRNTFKKPSEVMNVLWKRYSPATFTGVTKIDEQLAALNRCTPEEKLLLSSAASYKALDAVDAVKALDLTKSLISKSTTISEVDKEKVIELLKTQVNTGHGTRTEDKVVAEVSQRTGVSFQKDEKLYSYSLCTIGTTDYVVRGKIDRLVEDEGTGETVLVEVKSRMKNLFREVREYENVQVQTYFQMLPGNIKRARLIEQYGDETNEMNVDRDDELWQKEIRPSLLAFCADLHKSMNGSEESDEPISPNS